MTNRTAVMPCSRAARREARAEGRALEQLGNGSHHRRGRGDDGVFGRSLVASARGAPQVRSPLPAFGPSGPRQLDVVVVSRTDGEDQGGRPDLRQFDRSVTRCHLHLAVELRDERLQEALLVVAWHINGGRPEEGAQVVVHRRGERRQAESEVAFSLDAAPGGSSHQAMPWAGLPMSMDRSRGTRWSGVAMRGSTRRPDSVRVTSTVTSAAAGRRMTGAALRPGCTKGSPRTPAWPSRSQSLRLLIVSSRTTSSE